jgi:hypothetical protein
MKYANNPIERGHTMAQTKDTKSKVDLSAVSITKAPEPIKRKYNRKRPDNIFDVPLKRSFETAYTDANGKRHDRGEPQQTVPLTKAQLEAAHRALTNAGRHLGIGVRRQEIKADFGKVALRFQGVPLTERKRNGSGTASENGQGSAQQASEAAPVS